ncbi:MAG: sulfatase-like hydrolase/transferase [Campylobacter sp.]|nr:sulfatase-like hydrolase/transferase [Campylobacter sp.]
MSLICVFAFVIACVLAKFLPNRFSKILFCILAFVFVVAFALDLAFLWALEEHFGLKVYIFITTSIIGAPLLPFIKEILICAGILLAILLFCVMLYGKISTGSKNLKFGILSIMALGFAFFTHPFFKSVYEFRMLTNPPIEKYKAEIFPYIVKPMPKKPNLTKNIVYIYLESFNRDYTDERKFPNLTPNLNALKNRIDFSNISQGVDLDFTYKGIFGSHCALNYTFPKSDIKDIKFTQNILCASEILKNLGYHTYFANGSELGFQNMKNFLEQMKYDEMYGKSEISALRSVRQNSWGVDDDELLDFAWEDFARFSEGEKPFLMTLLSIGTHSPNGFLSKKCENLDYKYDDSMLKAVACTDFLASEFIDKIRSSKYAKNTIIVLQNDHNLPYDKGLGFAEKIRNSKSFFVIFDDELGGEIVVEKKGNSFDIFTSVLGYMGILDEMNLGRNLLKKESLSGEFDDEFYKKASRVFEYIEY